MNGSQGGRDDATAVVRLSVQNSPELQRLAEAQTALDHARQNAKWRRKCKTLQSAAHAVQLAAMAAHQAGIGWIEIGDVLGIERATPLPGSTQSSNSTPAEPESELVRHRARHVAATVHHLSQRPQAATG